MFKCPKCGCRIIAEQQDTRTGWWSVRCANLNCMYTAKEMPFLLMARIAWDVDKRRRKGYESMGEV